jgi:hypothetical protein
MGAATFGVVIDLTGDVEEGLRALDLDRLRVDRRVVDAARGVG